MMKIKDLMLGDWVKVIYNDNTDDFFFGEVCGFEDEYYVYTREDKEFRGHPWEPDKIEPIQVTPEILEKNGFVKEEEDELYSAFHILVPTGHERKSFTIKMNFYKEPRVYKRKKSTTPCKGKSIIHMSQSLCKIYLHIIFHVKTTSHKIADVHLERLHSYIGQLVNKTGCKVIRVGGIEDHVHILCLLSRNENIAHLVEEVKRNSSRWIKTLSPDYKQFAWQGGYAVFSVSQSVVDSTMAYVANQAEHHKKMSFREEYIKFLKLYNVDYDEHYIFSE